MRFQNASQKTLKTVAARPVLASQSLFTCRPLLAFRHGPRLVSQCRYHSTDPERIAVLGGGIAGLSSAYYVGKQFPNSEITLFEAGNDPGGWIRTRRVDVKDAEGKEGSVLFEQGPRALRPAPATAALIQELGLINDVTYTKRTDPGATNRFIYYPDKLNRLPSKMPIEIPNLISLWRSGLLAGFLGVIKEPWEKTRPAGLVDETVGSFIARRMDKRLADNLISAGFHGIYAGDIWQLSARTLAANPWNLENTFGSVIGGFIKVQNDAVEPRGNSFVHEWDRNLMANMKKELEVDEGFWSNLTESTQFSLRNGLQQLVRALGDAVEDLGNVKVKTMAPIQSFKPLSQDGKLGVEIVSGQEGSTSTESFDLAISTLREKDLTPYVTVMTINLYYPNPHLLPVEGFGYLIPQSVPFEQNPERGLGVIFDSSAIKGQDTVSGTKLTVMMGGHWWDGWESYPTEEEGLDMAKSLLARHLNITDEPTAHYVNLAKDCIPQYTLGYQDRLAGFAERMSGEFGGRVRFVGSQFNGVGVNDCVAGAWSVARELKDGGWMGRSCGLDKVGMGERWMVVPSARMKFADKGGRD
ncbi:protoporphyrinogen oxidase [Pyrenophora tritici-repentis]|uniref:Protoporphyrinogen oxidase n=2 Tax=Pyrenophora tritici-repentis TaxID=45151 RepID=A0A5M9LFJ1_9PLEO|nr:protoporphyrinogen oxidase [Pyrenophora tritici-repentis]KAF7452763.1 protoporphyrinogen oxidase [Pyrenophora tritici-repentis]KAI0572374.1 protoporphyrinogen oxidase [Pyrenophora tritici-repentis]KAI0582905.1 protoporphyrinogen oxidase [Pyrenophora tritici-repentis]KAI0609901.1 protoporphyrinogen oxidase [Pyrenophora tritici-repentis]